jgi:hypothetical protein
MAQDPSEIFSSIYYPDPTTSPNAVPPYFFGEATGLQQSLIDALAASTPTLTFNGNPVPGIFFTQPVTFHYEYAPIAPNTGAYPANPGPQTVTTDTLSVPGAVVVNVGTNSWTRTTVLDGGIGTGVNSILTALRKIAQGGDLAARESFAGFINGLGGGFNGFSEVVGANTVYHFNLTGVTDSVNVADDAAALATPTGQSWLSAFLQTLGLSTSEISTLLANQTSTDRSQLGDLQALVGGFDASATNYQIVSELFLNSFKEFLRTYDFDGLLSGPISATTGNEDDQFTAGYLRFLTIANSLGTTSGQNIGTGTVRTDTTDNNSQTTWASGFNPNSYLEIYRTFSNNQSAAITDPNFQALLGKYYKDMVADNGYFLPSQFLEGWIQRVQLLRSVTQVGIANPLAGNSSEKLDVIFTILKLLTDMIDTLQKAASAQFARLKFYANYQQAYTNLIEKIPIMTKEKFGGGDDNARKDSRDHAQTANNNYTQILQAYRQAISDEAKSFQTTANNSNESVNQQASLIEAILQELSTILQSVFQK